MGLDFHRLEWDEIVFTVLLDVMAEATYGGHTEDVDEGYLDVEDFVYP